MWRDEGRRGGGHRSKSKTSDGKLSISMLSASWKCYLLNNEIKCKYTLEKDKTGTEPTVFLLRGEQMERTECSTLFLQDAEMGEGEGVGNPH